MLLNWRKKIFMNHDRDRKSRQLPKKSLATAKSTAITRHL